ncbi:MAG TPA: GMC family oxidoreductase [Roseiarcus sp.]|jgi:choline dehydrogenase-like flavoprotein
MIRDLSASDDRQLTAKCGVCVIGGGIAGLIAASRLSASGRRVIVLESGDRKPLDRLDAFNVVEQAGETYQNAVTGRVRALGGTSNTWGGRIMPLALHDMAPRDYLGLSGWPIERADLDRFIPQIERLFRLDQSSYEDLPRSPLGRHDPLPGGRQDMTPRWSKWPTFRRRNVAHLLRDMVAIKRNPEVWLNATACDLSFDGGGGRLTAVKARSINGKRLTVFAEWFVLAAGTLETTRLLLQLDALTDGRAFSGCDALGRYLNDHLKIEAGRIERLDSKRTNLAFGYHIGGSTRRGLHLETTASAQREDQAASGYVTIRTEFQALSIHHYVRNLGKSVQARRFPELVPKREVAKDLGSLGRALYWRVRHKQMYFSPSVDLFVDARIEQAPSSLSCLTLSKSHDEFGAPLLQIDWRKTAQDKHTLRSVLLRARRFWRSTRLDVTSPVSWSIDPDQEDLIERTTDTRHPAGTARMGVDPRTSVVNPQLACHAIPNVFVASAAVFPSSGSSNPTLTIMQIACRAVESVMAVW